ncbi:MAG: hypothetical protein AAF624_01470 [Bacteroidota bacterium]
MVAMPQYEVMTGPDAVVLVRGRDALDAASRALDGHPEGLTLGGTDPHGWEDVLRNGTAVGQVRPHQRMRFRRD